MNAVGNIIMCEMPISPKSDELVDVQPMSPPTSLFDFFGFDWKYDLGYGVYLDADQCLKLIDWWNNKGGKEEYMKSL